MRELIHREWKEAQRFIFFQSERNNQQIEINKPIIENQKKDK